MAREADRGGSLPQVAQVEAAYWEFVSLRRFVGRKERASRSVLRIEAVVISAVIVHASCLLRIPRSLFESGAGG